jgi:TonB family protein
MSRLSPLAPVTLGLLILAGCSSTSSIPPRGVDVTESHVTSFRQKEDEQLLQKQVSPPLDAPLTLLEAPLPRYPSFLLNDTSLKARGNVTVSFEIMPSGLVGAARVVSGTGEDALHKPAIDAVRRWKFAPLLRNGEPARLMLQHTFRMEP